MARKKYMAIHTFHSDEMKKAFFRGLHKSELTDFEWRDGYIFEKCQCTGTWVGDDDFFFCQWESESEEDVLKALLKPIKMDSSRLREVNSITKCFHFGTCIWTKICSQSEFTNNCS